MSDAGRPDLVLEAAALRAELDLRWPGAIGDARATTDESHRLVLLHPQFDGFVSLEVTARADLSGVFVVPDRALARVVTAHHRTGPLERGQQLPIDLELHPGAVASPATSGVLELVDADRVPVAPPVRLTLATDTSLDCVLAGAVDGPFPDVDSFELAVAELIAARGAARRLARRIEALQRGDADPGWSRLPWRRT